METSEFWSQAYIAASYIVTLLIGFGLSVVANLATPTIREWWARRSVKRAQERIDELLASVAYAESLRESMPDLFLFVMRQLVPSAVAVLYAAFALVELFGPLFTSGSTFVRVIQSLAWAFATGALFYAFTSLAILSKALGNIANPRKYRLTVEAEIARLQARLGEEQSKQDV